MSEQPASNKDQRAQVKAGFLYVLIHPSDENLYKIGVTILPPEKRLAQHNSQYDKYAGKIVKETNQKWELKTYISVPDPYWAEKVFWSATSLADIPYRGGVEVVNLDLKSMLAGLEAAKNAGLRPSKLVPDWVHANAVWINKRLEGRGITLVGQVRSKFGKSNFLCSNDHQWRAVPNDVAQGKGCPICGTGTKDAEEIRQIAKAGVVSLLVHPDHPGLARVESNYGEPGQNRTANFSSGWEIHRYRRVEEPALAELLIWGLLGRPQPDGNELISVDLVAAEEALRQLTYRMHAALALRQRAANGSTTPPR